MHHETRTTPQDAKDAQLSSDPLFGRPWRLGGPFLVFVIALFALGLPGCSAPRDRPHVDTGPVLADLTENVLLPAHASLHAETVALRDAVAALSPSPTDALLARAQDAWRAAHRAWRRSDAFRFGPVERASLAPSIEYFPASGDKIEAAIAGAGAITEAAVEAGGSNARGFMALEYLLFDEAGGAAVLAKLDGEAGARRRAYTEVVARLLAGKTEALARAWALDGENFGAQVTTAGRGSDAFSTQKAAVDELVNRVIFAAELVVGTKIGKPAGKQSGGAPQPKLEESPRSDNSAADILATLEGARAVYTGTLDDRAGQGIAVLVRARNPALDERVAAAFEDAFAKVAALPRPYRSALVEQHPAVDEAYQATRALKNLLASEVAGALGTTLKFNDNDGD